jgi:2-C-methyl-D-erythritol 2,4-cyclodiphosphate synthase
VSFRVGNGFDAHRFVAGRPLMLGGVRLPHERGLAGHSDGDCLLHAVCDALLGAAGRGDLGQHFPSSDARFKDAASGRFVEAVLQLLGPGYAIENVDATVIADAPRLAAHLPALRDSLAGMLRLAPERVSVKAKSNDGMGAVGRGEGIAAIAVALLRTKEESDSHKP